MAIMVKEYFIDRDYTFSYKKSGSAGNLSYNCYSLVATNNATKEEIDTKVRFFIWPCDKIKNLNLDITNSRDIKRLEDEMSITLGEHLDLYISRHINNNKNEQCITIDLSANFSLDSRVSLFVNKVTLGANDRASLTLPSEAITSDVVNIEELIVANNYDTTISIESGIYKERNRPCHQMKIKSNVNSWFILDNYFGSVSFEKNSSSCFNDVGYNVGAQLVRFRCDEKDSGIISVKNLDLLMDYHLPFSGRFPIFSAPTIILENCLLKVRTPVGSSKYGNMIAHNREIMIKNIRVDLAGYLGTTSEERLEIRAKKDDLEQGIYDGSIVIEGSSIIAGGKWQISLAKMGTIKNTYISSPSEIRAYNFNLVGAEIIDETNPVYIFNIDMEGSSIKYPTINSSYEYRNIPCIKDISLKRVYLERPTFDYQERDIECFDDLLKPDRLSREKQIIVQARDKKVLKAINTTFVVPNSKDKIEVDFDAEREAIMYAGFFESCYFYGKNKVKFENVGFVGYSLFLNSEAVVKNFARITSAQVFGAVELDGDKQN